MLSSTRLFPLLLIVSSILQLSIASESRFEFDECHAWSMSGCPSVSPANTGEWTVEDTFLSVRCCSIDEADCTSFHHDAPIGIHSHKSAVAICASMGRKLCSREALQAGVCCGTGANYDQHRIWAADERCGVDSLCDNSGGNNNQPGCDPQCQEGFKSDDTWRMKLLDATWGFAADDVICSPEKCYFTPHFRFAWKPGAARCNELGGRLATIHTRSDSRLVQRAFRITLSWGRAVDQFWIGLSDTDFEGQFRWIDDSVLDFSEFGVGQPEFHLERNCVSERRKSEWKLGGDGEWGFHEGQWIWDDANCDSALPIVCEASRCVDIDECSMGTHDCDADAACLNTEGSFTCQCNLGFQGNGTGCTESDSECYAWSDSDCPSDAPQIVGEWTEYDTTLAVRCCSLDETDCTSVSDGQALSGFLASGDRFSSALAICASIGRKLCSRAAMNSGICCQSGSLTRARAWTSDQACGADVRCNTHPDGGLMCEPQCRKGFAFNASVLADISRDGVSVNVSMGNQTAESSSGVEEGPLTRALAELLAWGSDGEHERTVHHTPACSSDKCYVVAVRHGSWEDGQALCGELGGRLATIHTRFENTLVQRALSSSELYDDQVWIGLSDTIHIGQFRWIDGSALDFSEFGVIQHQPELGRGEKCATLRRESEWKGEDVGEWRFHPGQWIWDYGECDSVLPVVCEVSRCVEVDECSMSTHDCDADAACLNTEGSFTCQCNAGYEGNGSSCSDIDECTLDTHNCDPAHALCSDTDGSFVCECNKGFAGDGITCSHDEDDAEDDESGPPPKEDDGPLRRTLLRQRMAEGAPVDPGRPQADATSWVLLYVVTLLSAILGIARAALGQAQAEGAVQSDGEAV